MAERSTTVESVALTAISTGGALALVGTTLYWARVADSGGTFYLVRLGDVNRVAAPLAILWLVITAGAAFASLRSSPWATWARLGTTLCATVAAFFLLGQTVFGSDGTAMLAHAAVTDNPSLVTVRRVFPETGCILYVVGLLLIGVGTSIVEVATRGIAPAPSPPGGRPLLHRVVLMLALVVGGASAVLPWYRSSAADIVLPGTTSPPGNDDAQAWLGLYRAGFAACLAITILALVLRRQAPRLRLLGLIAGVAVTVMLVIGYSVLWRQPALRYSADHIGLGYHLGIVAMLALVASFAALPSGASDAIEEEADPEDADEEAGAAEAEDRP